MESKTINLNDIIEKYKDKVVNIAIIILALIIAAKIYTGKARREMDSLNQAKNSEIRKNELLAEIANLEKNINAYTKFINKKDITLVLTTLNNIARESMVELTSVRPRSKEDYPTYTKYGFDLSLEADNYNALGKFIAKLESHPDVYIVEAATLSPQQPLEAAEGINPKLSGTLAIYTILIKK